MKVITLDIETVSAATRFDIESMELSLIGIHDSETDLYDSFVQEELGRLWPLMEQADALVGYNSNHFDIPILNKYYPGDLAQIKSIDLLVSIRESLGRRLKLDSIAKATLGTKKSGDGLQAVKWWQEGKIEKVRKYCLDDVKITKEIYEYALKNEYLKYNDFGEMKKIPIDTSDWLGGEKNTLTHTLPF